MEPNKPLDDSTLSEVIRRAQEISEQTTLIFEPHPDIEQYIQAAEEAGISRDATMQALRERLDFPVRAFQPGELVFALSGDERFYVAKIVQIEGRQAQIRFLSGSDHHCEASDLRRFSLMPGQKVQYNSPTHHLWVSGKLEGFNRDANSITATWGGVSETLPLDKIRLPREGQTQQAPAIPLWVVGVASGLGGGIVGAILMRLLMR